MSKVNIKHLLRSRDGWIDVSVGSALTELTAFLATVQDDGFTVAYRRLSGEQDYSIDAIGAVNGVADRIVEKLSPSSAALFAKALQEALLDVSGIKYDIELGDVESGLKTFLAGGSRSDFIQLVLVLYVFNSIWISLQDEIRKSSHSEDAFLKSMSDVQSLSHTAAAEVIKESIADQELERAGTDPDAGVRIMARVQERVLGG